MRTSRREVVAVLGASMLTPRVMARARKAEVFGHRGASALRPEHTLASYLKAIEDGADFIEPDLLITRDGELVIRHEPNIAETTDIARRPEFAGRRTEKVIDGRKQVGWFVEDFTLAEFRTLRAIERLPELRPQNAAMDGRFPLVTWREMIDFTAAEARKRGRAIGLVPELKHSTYFRSIDLPLEDRFLATLGDDYIRRAPLIVQSFEVQNLRYLRGKLGRRAGLRLMQLIDPNSDPADATQKVGEMLKPEGLKAVATYADILAPDTRTLIPLASDGRLLRPSAVVANAHRAGLQVMPYTFRPENHFLAADFRDARGAAARNATGSVAEMRAYLQIGIDGFFTDDPGLGRQAVDGS